MLDSGPPTVSPPWEQKNPCADLPRDLLGTSPGPPRDLLGTSSGPPRTSAGTSRPFWRAETPSENACVSVSASPLLSDSISGRFLTPQPSKTSVSPRRNATFQESHVLKTLETLMLKTSILDPKLLRKTTPKFPTILPGSLSSPKGHPRDPQGSPKDLQRTSKRPQRTPKDPQRSHKGPQRLPKDSPKHSQSFPTDPHRSPKEPPRPPKRSRMEEGSAGGRSPLNNNNKNPSIRFIQKHGLKYVLVSIGLDSPISVASCSLSCSCRRSRRGNPRRSTHRRTTRERKNNVSGGGARGAATW